MGNGDGILQVASRIVAAAGDPADADYGYKWRVQVVEYGLGADGRINWPRAPLAAALPLYEGAKVFALNDSQHQAAPKPFGKSVREIVGWLANPTDTGTGIEADLYILKSAKWLRDGLVDSHERGNPTLFGLSHDVTAQVATRTVAGKKVKEPVTITGVEVDVVYAPTNNGQFLRMAAAAAAGTQEEQMKQKLLAALQKARPDEFDKINQETITEDELIALLASNAAQGAGGGADAEKIAAAVAAAMKPLLVSDGSPDLEKVKLLAAGLTLDRELSASKLPEFSQARLRKRFEGQVFEAEQLAAAIKEEKEAVDHYTASGAVTGAGGARVIVDSHEKAVSHLNDFFDGKAHSFKAAYVQLTGDERITGQVRDAVRLQAALTMASFPQVLGDSIARRMVAEYNLAGLGDWRKICEVVPLTDFRTQRRTRFGGYGNLAAVAESGPYVAVVSPTDEEATYAASKVGGLETITLEMIKNDDVGSIRRIPVKLGRAAARTLYDFVFAFLDGNGLIYDGVALFAAGHANLLVAALAGPALAAARLQMVQQQDFGANDFLGIPPKYLIVPSGLEDTAYTTTVQPNLGGFVPTAPDAVRRQTWEVIVNARWADQNNWYLAADPKDIPTIEIGFLDGREEPELFVQDMPNVGSMFSNDQLTYKIRHIYGGAVMDYRGLQGNIVP